MQQRTLLVIYCFDLQVVFLNFKRLALRLWGEKQVPPAYTVV